MYSFFTLTGVLITEDHGFVMSLDIFLPYKNQLAGTIPTEIGNLNRLTWMDMGEWTEKRGDLHASTGLLL